MEEDLTTHNRGLHIVIVNPLTGKVVLAKVFDTYISSEEFERFAKDKIDFGFIVIAACKDECT